MAKLKKMKLVRVDMSTSRSEVEPLMVTEFTLFPKLPIEIRLAVWDAAASDFPTRQNIKIIEIHRKTAVLVPARQPSLSHVNHEARATALKYYKLLNITSPVYMAMEHDVLHFPHSHVLRYLTSQRSLNVEGGGQARNRLATVSQFKDTVRHISLGDRADYAALTIFTSLKTCTVTYKQRTDDKRRWKNVWKRRNIKPVLLSFYREGWLDKYCLIHGKDGWAWVLKNILM